MIYNTKIEQVVDVQDFFHFITYDLHLNFHPDDPFEAEEGFITAEEAKELNSLMKQCFTVCEDQGAEIYELAMDVWTSYTTENNWHRVDYWQADNQ